MNETNKSNKIDKIYIIVFFIAVFLSWLLHEFAHWMMGKYLGYNMEMTLNKTFPVNQVFLSNRDYQLVSAAGPIFTLSEAFLIFFLMLHKKRRLLYPFLFTCFYMRFFATLISVRNPNDEARISRALGLGKFTLPIIITGLLFFLVLKISSRYKFDLKFNFINLGLIIVASSIIILADQYLHVRIL